MSEFDYDSVCVYGGAHRRAHVHNEDRYVARGREPGLGDVVELEWDANRGQLPPLRPVGEPLHYDDRALVHAYVRTQAAKHSSVGASDYGNGGGLVYVPLREYNPEHRRVHEYDVVRDAGPPHVRVDAVAQEHDRATRASARCPPRRRPVKEAPSRVRGCVPQLIYDRGLGVAGQ